MADRHVYRNTYWKWKREQELAEQVSDLRETILIEAMNRWHGHRNWSLDSLRGQAKQRKPHGVDGPMEIIFRGEAIFRIEPPELSQVIPAPGQMAYSVAYEFLGRCAREAVSAD